MYLCHIYIRLSNKAAVCHFFVYIKLCLPQGAQLSIFYGTAVVLHLLEGLLTGALLRERVTENELLVKKASGIRNPEPLAGSRENEWWQ